MKKFAAFAAAPLLVLIAAGCSTDEDPTVTATDSGSPAVESPTPESSPSETLAGTEGAIHEFLNDPESYANSSSVSEREQVFFDAIQGSIDTLNENDFQDSPISSPYSDDELLTMGYGYCSQMSDGDSFDLLYEEHFLDALEAEDLSETEVVEMVVDTATLTASLALCPQHVESALDTLDNFDIEPSA